jgi:hypothetical protein
MLPDNVALAVPIVSINLEPSAGCSGGKETLTLDTCSPRHIFPAPGCLDPLLSASPSLPVITPTMLSSAMVLYLPDSLERKIALFATELLVNGGSEPTYGFMMWVREHETLQPGLVLYKTGQFLNLFQNISFYLGGEQ